MNKEQPAPDFFIIGAPKCGTSALSQYLAEHPHVFFCAPKEPFYWSKDHPKAQETHRLSSLESYLRLFKGADLKQHKAIGEGSTNYLQSQVAVEEILKFRPDARFIVMLRNPVDVVHGMHGELRRHFAEDEPDFEKAWVLQEKRSRAPCLTKNDRMIHQLQYRDVAAFARQLRRVFDQVDPSRRLVIIFDDFVRDPRASYLQTLQFLGLPDDNRTDFPKVNAAGTYRLQLIGRLYQDPPPFLKSPIGKFKTWYSGRGSRLRHWIHGFVQKQSPRESLSPEFREHLKSVFFDEIHEVSSLLGRDLTSWVHPVMTANTPITTGDSTNTAKARLL